MDWNQIVLTFLTACIPALIAYLTSYYQTKSKLKELTLNHKHQIEIMKLQQENKQDDLKNQLTLDVMSKMGLEESMKGIVQQMIASQLKEQLKQQRKG